MGSEATGHRLAPVALLRAAAFPFGRLEVLGDPELARLARVTEGDGVGPALADAHAAATTRERRLLREATTEDAAFMKALVIANPQLARAAAAPPERQRKKAAARARRLHGALYRHLARAVGRTEPADLWAGVALVRWGEETSVTEQPSTVLVQPDLRPFQAILRGIAGRSAYVRSETWRANATLLRHHDGTWTYAARLPDGRLVDRVLQPNAFVDLVVPRLPSAALTLGGLARRLVEPLGVEETSLGTRLEAFVGAGLLVGGLDLPTRFATPWEALDRAGRRLQGGDAPVWAAAVASLRRCADELEARLASMSPEEVARLADTAECIVADLAARLGVVVGPSRGALRCDLGLGIGLTLGPDLREQLDDAIGEREDPAGPHSAGRRLRGELAARLRGELGVERTLAEAAVLFRSPRVERAGGASSAGDPGAVADGTHPAGPFGCLLASVETSGESPASLRVRGVFDEVAPLYGRFAPLWSDSGAEPADPLFPWLVDGLGRLGEDCGLRIAELAGPCEANPNALAAPSFVSDVVELWGTTESGTGLGGARLRTDPATGSPVVRMPHCSEDVVVLSFSSADLARDDRTTELLLATGARLAPAPSFEAAEAVPEEPGPVAGRRTEERGALATADHRTVLGGEEVEGLRTASDALLYLRWQRLSAAHGWPDTVRVRMSPVEPALLVRTTSPVAVEAVLGRIGADVVRIVVEPVDRLPWLADRAGDRYVCELAVPFSRPSHLWSARAEVADR